MGETRVVAWTGTIDAQTAPALTRDLFDVLADDTTTAVAIDLADVTVMDSTGLGALVRVSNTAGELGKTIALRSTPVAISRLLARVGLDQVFDSAGPTGQPSPADDLAR